MNRAWASLRDEAPRRSARLGLLVALFVAARMLFVGIPNVTPAFFVVLAAGLLFGPLMGALVGGLGMVVTNLMLTGFHPVLFANASAMALLGGLAGLLGRWFDSAAPGRAAWVAATTLGAVGVLFTVTFSVAADLAHALTAYLYEPGGGAHLTWGLVVGGLLFNLPSTLANAALFAAATVPVLRAVRSAGLAPPPHPQPRPAHRPGAAETRKNPGRVPRGPHGPRPRPRARALR